MIDGKHDVGVNQPWEICLKSKYMWRCAIYKNQYLGKKKQLQYVLFKLHDLWNNITSWLSDGIYVYVNLLPKIA